MTNDPFWVRKSLDQMSRTEWESLCDGCGKCCVHKLEDEVTGDVFPTNVCCRLLNRRTARCADYANRKTLVPDCIVLTPKLARTMDWLPESCAYRRLALGQALPEWHPLVTGDPDSPRKAGATVAGRVLSESDVGDLEDFILDTPL